MAPRDGECGWASYSRLEDGLPSEEQRMAHGPTGDDIRHDRDRNAYPLLVLRRSR
jgi:hypothetical protein